MSEMPALPSVWSHRDFTLFWAARAFSNLAVQAESVTLGWQVYTLARLARTVEESAFMVGMVRSGPAIGAALMADLLSRWPIHRRAGMWMFSGVAVFGLATLVFAISKSLVLSVGALVVLGAADMISVYVRQSLVQISTPDRMRGRVSAVAGLFIGASAELGEFETGVAARIVGPIGAAIFGGLGSLVITGAWTRMFPALRKADRLNAIQTEPPQRSKRLMPLP